MPTSSSKPEVDALYRKQLNNDENHKAKSHLVNQAANTHTYMHTHTYACRHAKCGVNAVLYFIIIIMIILMMTIQSTSSRIEH